MRLAALAFATVLAPCAAQAGAAACWFEQGVVVVPASVAGVDGDYILDTGTAVTLLHETRAQGAGFEATSLHGDIRVAGQRLRDQPIAVADLDARTAAFPTPIAGVLGADLLSQYVLDLSFAPCRVALYRPGHAPPWRAKTRLALHWSAGQPTVRAAVADGPHALAGDFVAATGADASLRLTDAKASTNRGDEPEALLPYGPLRAQLRALSLAGDLTEDLESGLLKAAEADGNLGNLGTIGAPVLAHYRLRFDFPNAALLLAPAEPPKRKRPRSKPGP